MISIRASDDLNPVHLKELVKKAGDSFIYTYDFGDGWRHEVILEEIIYPEETPPLVACCVVGRRACPPEDVGGIGGYAEFIEIIEDPHNMERFEKLEWAGGDFDADSFDIRGVNLRLLELTESLFELEAVGQQQF
ncbi:hypothetical protein BH10CYA1_BH10CYA1_62560 [soil metagenome]